MTCIRLERGCCCVRTFVYSQIETCRFNLRPTRDDVEQMSKSIFNHRGGIRMDMITGAMLQLGWTEVCIIQHIIAVIIH
jgi:hypothetical protein